MTPRRSLTRGRGLAALLTAGLLVAAVPTGIALSSVSDEEPTAATPSVDAIEHPFDEMWKAQEELDVDLTAHMPPPSAEVPVLSGDEALEALGGANGADLAAVAAAHRMSPDQLAQSLLGDDTLHVNSDGRLIYRDTFSRDDHGDHEDDQPAPSMNPDGSIDHPQAFSSSGTPFDEFTAPAGTRRFPLSETFKLHSRPDSPRTIYLDFDGHTFEAGDGWFAPGTTYCGWDVSGNGPAFDATEREMVQQTWRIVAAHFDGFDVNVTTEDPGREALFRRTGAAHPNDAEFGVRVVVSGDPNMVAWQPPAPWCAGLKNGGTLGWGNYHSFGSTSSNTSLAMGTSGASLTAYIINHEVGHQLGLIHTFETTDDQTYPQRTMDYNVSGAHVGFSQPERLYASPYFWRPNPDTPNDSSANWAHLPSIRNDITTAAPITVGDSVEATLNFPFTPTAGVRPVDQYPVDVAQQTPLHPADEDWYALGECTHVAAAVRPKHPYAVLDLKLSLRNSLGVEIARHAPVGRDGAQLSAVLPTTGAHYLVVSGSSSAEGGEEATDPHQVNGHYPAAHSSGIYTLDLTTCGDSPAPPTDVAPDTAPDGTVTVSWTAPRLIGDDAAVTDSITGYDVALDGRRMVSVDADQRSHTFPATPEGQYARVRTRSATGVSEWSEAIVLTGPIRPLAVKAEAVMPSGQSNTPSRVEVTITHDPRWLAQIEAAGETGVQPSPSTRSVQVQTVNASNGSISFYNRSPSTTKWILDSPPYIPPLGQTLNVTVTRPGYPSASIPYTVVLKPGAADPLEAPAGLRLTSTTTSTRLHWDPPAGSPNSISHYILRNGSTTIEIETDSTSIELPSQMMEPGTTLELTAHPFSSALAPASTTFDLAADPTAGKPSKVRLEENSSRTSLTWAPYTQQAYTGTLAGWQVTVGERSFMLPADATRVELAGFRSERTTSVTLAAVTSHGTGATRTVRLAPGQ